MAVSLAEPSPLGFPTVSLRFRALPSGMLLPLAICLAHPTLLCYLPTDAFALGMTLLRDAFHKAVEKQFVVALGQGGKDVPSGLNDCLFTLTLESADHICVSRHVVIVAPAPIHTVSLELAGSAALIVVAPLFQKTAAPC